VIPLARRLLAADVVGRAITTWIAAGRAAANPEDAPGGMAAARP
jgi:hypothetical protein